jgi:hypothetical protein
MKCTKTVRFTLIFCSDMVGVTYLWEWQKWQERHIA